MHTHTYTQHYPEVQRERSKDLQSDTESLSSLSVQIFTVPSIANELIEEHNLLETMFTFMQELLEPCLLPNGLMDGNAEALDTVRLSLAHVIADVVYLVQHQTMSSVRYLPALLDVLSRIQLCDPLKRAVLQHVEHEAEGWYQMFNITLQFGPALQSIIHGLVRTVSGMM